MSRKLCSPFIARVRHVATPSKISKNRLDRVQKVNKVTKCLFGPVVKNEFKSLAKAELTKYQLEASNKWGFDFSLDKPCKQKNQYSWETVKINEIPKMYHVISVNSRVQHHPSMFDSKPNNQIDIEYFSSCNNSENMCPLVDIKKPIIVKRMIGKRNHQTKITDFLKEKKRRVSTSSVISLKKSQ